ncbi:FAD-binding oxidoreductase [Altererythrobacter lauratis]|uniref:NAD(P)/FAD-dependent oxidoreductase n=1 Tax=Alteraurantiacibacter lauratis TaxID=2054627 RepID=A0ABV7EDA5_9SPHN
MADPLANSYYAASVDRPAPHPALEGQLSADVCVVGGGFTGLSAALACAEAGLDTVLLEAEVAGFGASGRNGGQLIPGLNKSGPELVAMLGKAHAEALYRLALSARERVHDRIARHAIDCDLRAGHFHVAAKPAHFAAFAEECAFVNRLLGYEDAVLVPPAEVSRYLAVDGYHGGIYVQSGGHFHPLKYALGLARAAEAAGVRLFEHSRVTSVADGVPATVRTATGKVRAGRVILACDAMMADLSPDAGRFTMPVLNYNIATEPLGEERARALIPSGAAVSDSRFVLNYFRISADNRLIFAGGEKYTPKPPADIAGFVRPHMLRLFPQLADARIDYAWGGAVGITRNRLPQFGQRGNLLFAHGFSGLGALLTTLAGDLLAEAVQGKRDRFDLFARIPHRPFPGGKLLRTPLYVLGMAYAAASDRL